MILGVEGIIEFKGLTLHLSTYSVDKYLFNTFCVPVAVGYSSKQY